MNDAGAERLLAALDQEQRDVATTLDGPMAVIAGPGTGKTRAVTSRIAYAAATGAADPKATLAVTFTTRAAEELRSRLAGVGVTGVAARTFHSAALAQAKFFWPVVFGVQLPRVTDSPVRLLAEVLPRFGLPDPALAPAIAQEIAWTKQSNVVPERYARAANAAGRRLDAVRPEQMADILVEYERTKQGLGLIDFDDILLCAAAVLQESEEAARQMARHYRHFVVDEFQDVSPIQSRLIDLWRGPHHDVCVVGDPAQTIHGFAGARSQYLIDFARSHPGCRQARLARNYRSSSAIVTVANALMADHGGVTLRSQRPAGPAVEWAAARSERREAQAAAEWLADRAGEGLAWSEMALLYRSHAQAAEVGAALRERDLPCHVERGADRLGGATGAGSGAPSAAGVTCTTLHAAKGREWEAVALVGVSDGLVPHLRAVTEREIEEERRLLYVGVTRARRHLRVSWVGERGQGHAGPSRFLTQAGLV